MSATELVQATTNGQKQEKELSLFGVLKRKYLHNF